MLSIDIYVESLLAGWTRNQIHLSQMLSFNIYMFKVRFAGWLMNKKFTFPIRSRSVMAGHLEKKPIEEEFEAEEQTKTTKIFKYKEQDELKARNPDAY